MTDYGNLKPDDDLTDVFTKVVKDVSRDDYGSVKAGTNTALLTALYVLQDEDPDAVQYHLSREGYDSMQELGEAVLDRQQVPFAFDIDEALSDPAEVIDGDFSAELQDVEDGGD